MSRIYVSKQLHAEPSDTPDIPTPTAFVSTAGPLPMSSLENEIITPDNFNNHNFETSIVKQEPYDESQDDFALSNKIDESPTLTQKKKVSPKKANDLKRKFPCPIFGCIKSYGKSSHLRSHLTWHTGIKPFVCEIEECGKSFTRSDELARHMRTHTGEKPFECFQCFKKFSRSDHLTKHIATHKRQMVGNIKRRKTVKTGGTNDKTTIKARDTIAIVIKNECEEMHDEMHLLDVTLKEKEQQSVKEIADTNLIKEEEDDDINSNNECNEEEEVKKNIKQELIVPDDYDISPASNSNDPELTTSKLSKPFQCHFDCCSKAFSRSDDLNRHIRTHTGEKPYACEECNKRFIRSDHLKKHIMTHCKKTLRAH